LKTEKKVFSTAINIISTVINIAVVTYIFWALIAKIIAEAKPLDFVALTLVACFAVFVLVVLAALLAVVVLPFRLNEKDTGMKYFFIGLAGLFISGIVLLPLLIDFFYFAWSEILTLNAEHFRGSP